MFDDIKSVIIRWLDSLAQCLLLWPCRGGVLVVEVRFLLHHRYNHHTHALQPLSSWFMIIITIHHHHHHNYLPYHHNQLPHQLCHFSCRRAGADPNARDNWSYTPLHEASIKGKNDVCVMLLQVSAFLFTLNNWIIILLFGNCWSQYKHSMARTQVCATRSRKQHWTWRTLWPSRSSQAPTTRRTTCWRRQEGELSQPWTLVDRPFLQWQRREAARPTDPPQCQLPRQWWKEVDASAPCSWLQQDKNCPAATHSWRWCPRQGQGGSGTSAQCLQLWALWGIHE